MSNGVMCLPAQLRPLISLKKPFSHLTPVSQGPGVMAETSGFMGLRAQNVCL